MLVINFYYKFIRHCSNYFICLIACLAVRVHVSVYVQKSRVLLFLLFHCGLPVESFQLRWVFVIAKYILASYLFVFIYFAQTHIQIWLYLVDWAKIVFFFARFSTHETSPYVIYMCVRACGDLNFYFLFVDLFVFVTSCDWIFHAYISKIDSQFQYTFWWIFECIEIHCIKFNLGFDVRPNKFTFIKWNKSMQFAVDKLKRIKVQLGWNEIRCEKFIVLKFCSKWRESECVCVHEKCKWVRLQTKSMD